MRALLHRFGGVLTAVAVVGLMLSSAGCGGGGGSADPKTQKELADLGAIYHSHNEGMRGKAPTKVEDLAPYAADHKAGYEALKAGKYEFVWNVPLQAMMKTGTDKVVLAYEKDVPTKGGAVVMADGSVKKMTADEFQKSPKATP